MKSLDPRKLYDEIKDKAKVVAVTKNHTWDEVSWIYDAGCRDFGENKVQEALIKIAQAPSDINWSFIGTLQKNKVSKVVGKFALIQSVDSLELAQKISSMNIPSPILLQVNITHEHGFTPDDLRRDFTALQALPNLSLQGLMTMAPFTSDPAPIRSCFRNLRLLRDEFHLKELSMGMSNDYPIALDEGATILRLGTIFFGPLV